METGRSTGSDHWAALTWLSEYFKNRPTWLARNTYLFAQYIFLVFLKHESVFEIFQNSQAESFYKVDSESESDTRWHFHIQGSQATLLSIRQGN